MKYPVVNSRKSKILSLLLALLLSNRIMAADNPFRAGELIIKQSVAIDDEGSGNKAGAKAETGQNFPLKENFTSGSKTFAPVIVSSRSELLKKIAELKNGGGTIYLKGGAWNQSIFIKMEENRKNNDWIKVSGNRIFNDHVWGIRIHGFSQANQAEIARANLLQKIATIGSDRRSATKPLVKVD